MSIGLWVHMHCSSTPLTCHQGCTQPQTTIIAATAKSGDLATDTYTTATCGAHHTTTTHHGMCTENQHSSCKTYTRYTMRRYPGVCELPIKVHITTCEPPFHKTKRFHCCKPLRASTEHATRRCASCASGQHSSVILTVTQQLNDLWLLLPCCCCWPCWLRRCAWPCPAALLLLLPLLGSILLSVYCLLMSTPSGSEVCQ